MKFVLVQGTEEGEYKTYTPSYYFIGKENGEFIERQHTETVEVVIRRSIVAGWAHIPYAYIDANEVPQVGYRREPFTSEKWEDWLKQGRDHQRLPHGSGEMWVRIEPLEVWVIEIDNLDNLISYEKFIQAIYPRFVLGQLADPSLIIWSLEF